jgi:hypothetical protein
MNKRPYLQSYLLQPPFSDGRNVRNISSITPVLAYGSPPHVGSSQVFNIPSLFETTLSKDPKRPYVHLSDFGQTPKMTQIASRALGSLSQDPYFAQVTPNMRNIKLEYTFRIKFLQCLINVCDPFKLHSSKGEFDSKDFATIHRVVFLHLHLHNGFHERKRK